MLPNLTLHVQILNTFTDLYRDMRLVVAYISVQCVLLFIVLLGEQVFLYCSQASFALGLKRVKQYRHHGNRDVLMQMMHKCVHVLSVFNFQFS